LEDDAASAGGTGGESTLGTPEQEGRRVVRATGLLGGLTAASRLMGLARDMGQAALLGTGMAADAFTLAFIIPNILRRLFGEATVSAALVPTYTETLVSESREQAGLLGSRITTFVACVLGIIVVAGIAAAPLLVKVFAPGFADVPGKTGLTAGLLQVMFPFILFVGVGTVLMGILNSHRHFLSPAMAPIFFNLSAIAGIFLLSRVIVPDAPVWGYAVGITVGGLLQVAVQVPALRNRGVRLGPDFHWRDPRFRRILKLAVPALIGLIAGEVNVLVDQMIASFLQPGSVAALSYGLRVMQVPQGIFAIALATALLPTLSRQTVMGKMDEAGRTLSKATLALTALMIPCTLCIVFLAGPIVRVVLARGAFTETSVSLTTAALTFYSLGLVFYSGVRITAPVFYAMKDTRTPVKIAVGCMGLNIVLNVALTLLFIRTGVFLRRTLRRRTGFRGGGDTRAWLAVLPASAASAAFLAIASGWVRTMSGESFLHGAGAVAGASLAALAVFFAVFHTTGGEGARSLLLMVRRREP
jgi:putative peptidoglycan lipid II flippase